jgi:hypothetical protein
VLAAITLDRKDFPENLLQPLIAPLTRTLVELQKTVVRIRLDLSQIGQLKLPLNPTEINDSIHLQNTFSGDRHAIFSTDGNEGGHPTAAVATTPTWTSDRATSPPATKDSGRKQASSRSSAPPEAPLRVPIG